jgi:hypothetical protein
MMASVKKVFKLHVEGDVDGPRVEEGIQVRSTSVEIVAH